MHILFKNILLLKKKNAINWAFQGKIRDLFKKIRDTKGTFHAKIGTVKDRSDMDLTEAEDIKKRWQEYTEELFKKDPGCAYNMK